MTEPPASELEVLFELAVEGRLLTLKDEGGGERKPAVGERLRLVRELEPCSCPLLPLLSSLVPETDFLRTMEVLLAGRMWFEMYAWTGIGKRREAETASGSKTMWQGEGTREAGR